MHQTTLWVSGSQKGKLATIYNNIYSGFMSPFHVIVERHCYFFLQCFFCHLRPLRITGKAVPGHKKYHGDVAQWVEHQGLRFLGDRVQIQASPFEI